jgi:enoyl-CoA hydratase/carnithine racemase
MSEAIVYATRGHVATITMNRPEARNAITVEMIEAFSAALSAAAADHDVRVLILTGAGRAFCVGADLRQLSRWKAEPGLRERFCAQAADMFALLAQFPRPVIAAVNGTAAAGGFELCCFADLVIAADDAMIGDAHANFVGFGPVSAVMAATVLPPKLAHELLYTGEMWPARRLVDAGFVNRVVPADQVVATANELASAIAGKPPLASMHAKELLRRSRHQDAITLLPDAFERARRIFESRDFAEGLAAFGEKRPPNFTGR